MYLPTSITKYTDKDSIFCMFVNTINFQHFCALEIRTHTLKHTHTKLTTSRGKLKNLPFVVQIYYFFITSEETKKDEENDTGKAMNHTKIAKNSWNMGEDRMN